MNMTKKLLSGALSAALLVGVLNVSATAAAAAADMARELGAQPTLLELSDLRSRTRDTSICLRRKRRTSSSAERAFPRQNTAHLKAERGYRQAPRKERTAAMH